MKAKEKDEPHDVSQSNGESARRVVLVGTYKGDQLKKWRGWYNYPIKNEELKVESGKCGADGNSQPSTPNFNLINELWLFKGTKDERRYKAEFVGVKTRQELIDDYGYPAKGKAHGDKYLLFKIDFEYRHKGERPEDADKVIVRLRDFATAPKIRRQLKAYLESPDRNDPDLATRLPSIITRLPPDLLRVCETTVQMNLFAWNDLQPVHLPRKNDFTAIELFAGAGGLSIELRELGYDTKCQILNAANCCENMQEVA